MSEAQAAAMLQLLTSIDHNIKLGFTLLFVLIMIVFIMAMVLYPSKPRGPA